MSQHAELAKVKARIKALSEKTVDRGCTEAEALAAAEMVGRLLERYALTMEEIDVRAETCVQVEIKTGGKRRRPIDLSVTAIARFVDCKVWFTQSGSYMFFGLEHDTAMARYLYEVVDRAIAVETAAFKRNSTATGAALRMATQSFARGMAHRVAVRLMEMRKERDAEVTRQRASTGTALMVIKEQMVEDAFKQTSIKLVSCKHRVRISNGSAYHQGYEAGAKVNLTRPVEQGAGHQRLAA